MKITNSLKKKGLLMCVDFDEKNIRLKALNSKNNLFNDKSLII